MKKFKKIKASLSRSEMKNIAGGDIDMDNSLEESGGSFCGGTCPCNAGGPSCGCKTVGGSPLGGGYGICVRHG